MSEYPAPEFRWTPLAAAVCVAGIAALTIFQPTAIPHDVEELYNAAHARLLQAGWLKHWQVLQYRGHCGGCTHNALLGAALFNAFGHSLFVWKLVAVLFLGVLAYAGGRLLLPHTGPMGPAVYGLLLVLAPPTFLELSMTSWGNHFESGVAAVVVFAAASTFKRKQTLQAAALLGVCQAWALWIGFSSAFAVLGAAWFIRRDVTRRHVAVIALSTAVVGLIWLLQAISTPASAFDTIYQSGESIPDPTRIPAKVWSLVAPRQLVALFGTTAHPWGWWAGWGVASSGLVAAWVSRQSPLQPAILAFMFWFLCVYSVVRFTVWTPPAPEIAPPGSMRYAAPVYGLFFLMLSLGVARLWRSRHRIGAILLLLPSVAVGLSARAPMLADPFPDATVLEMNAADFEYARDQIAYLFTLEEHQSWRGSGNDVADLHAYGAGWAKTKRILDADPAASITDASPATPAALEGIASALLGHLDGSETGDVSLTETLLTRIDALSPDEQRAIVTAASWRRAWVRPSGDHGVDAFRNWQRRVADLPPLIQEATTVAFGRRWAHDTIRWRTPGSPRLPDSTALDPGLRPFFWSGYAEGMGERLGRAARDVEAPEAAVGWTDGIDRGLRRRWLSRSR